MAKKICSKCKEEKTIANFIATNSPMFEGTLPICRDCLNQMIAAAPLDDQWNIVDQICQWADIPFIPGEWCKVKERGKDALSIYMAMFRASQYSDLNWRQYNKIYEQLQKQNQLENAIPEIREDKIQKLHAKWGREYDDEQLEYLENLHKGLLNSQNVVGALNEDQAMKLCMISLLIEEKVRAGDPDIAKFLKAYDDLTKISNFTPKDVKNADEFDSSGEVYAYLEKTGFKPKIYQAVRDEVDQTEKNMQQFVRYLYVNETGIAEEIEQRIQNLKVAAELEGDDFNEKEFREYMDEQNKKQLEEEFKIDI